MQREIRRGDAAIAEAPARSRAHQLERQIDTHSVFSRKCMYMKKEIDSVSPLASQGCMCRLITRKEKGPAEIMPLVIGAVEVGQQVVIMAGPTFLKELANNLSDHGLRSHALLHNGRLIFLTAPGCLSQLAKAGDPLQRGPLRRNGSLLRWVSDWSWAYALGSDTSAIIGYQHLVHEFAQSLGAISVCTVCCEGQARNTLLAVLVDHRRAMRTVLRPATVLLPLSIPGQAGAGN